MNRSFAMLTVAAVFAASACDKTPANPEPSDEPVATQEAASAEEAQADPGVDQPAADQPAADQPAADQPAADDFAGRVEPEAILQKDRSWRQVFEQAAPDEQASAKLAEVDPGAEVVVYLGVWCGDSRREVPRFWKALELAGNLPFEVSYVGVDRSFEAGEVSLEEVGLKAVPTFVVSRDGEEVGRVVETSPNGIERDVLGLLTGEKSGVISKSR